MKILHAFLKEHFRLYDLKLTAEVYNLSSEWGYFKVYSKSEMSAIKSLQTTILFCVWKHFLMSALCLLLASPNPWCYNSWHAFLHPSPDLFSFQIKCKFRSRIVVCWLPVCFREGTWQHTHYSCSWKRGKEWKHGRKSPLNWPNVVPFVVLSGTVWILHVSCTAQTWLHITLKGLQKQLWRLH